MQIISAIKNFFSARFTYTITFIAIKIQEEQSLVIIIDTMIHYKKFSYIKFW